MTAMAHRTNQAEMTTARVMGPQAVMVMVMLLDQAAQADLYLQLVAGAMTHRMNRTEMATAVLVEPIPAALAARPELAAAVSL